MYVRLKSSKSSKNPSIQIVEGIREGKKVKQRVIASLGVASNQKSLQRLFKMAEKLICTLEEQGLSVPAKIELEKLRHVRTEYDGFATIVRRLMDLTGFSKIFQQAQGKRRFDLQAAVELVIAQRLNVPSSKLRTYERQQDFGFEEIDLQHLYRAMDGVAPLSDMFQERALDIVRSMANRPVDCFFFDVTTLYFESVRQNEVRDFGFSKDHKHHSVQVVFALVVDSQGLPLAYEVFKGNVAETKTLIPVLTSLKTRFSIQNVTVVCDRGLASRANVEALQQAEFHFVIAAKLRSLSQTLNLTDRSKYEALPNQQNIRLEERTLFRVMDHPQYADTLLVVTYSATRAAKDRSDRERLLEKLEGKIGDGSNAASVKKVMGNSGYKKFTKVKSGSSVCLDRKAIEADAAWDGFHGIAVSKSAQLTPSEALARYKDLWRVEETFRIAKSTLRIRPIFHWKPSRIKAHILLCFVTLFFERYLELLLCKNGLPLTPDRIRRALMHVHTMHFEDAATDRQGRLESQLTEDAEKIFEVLGISSKRQAAMTSCCA